MTITSPRLDAFHAVAETGSFSRAAKRLRITQPALSQRIQQLENDLQKHLFVRNPSGVVLTDAGVRLLRFCQVQRALASELLEDLAVDSRTGPDVELAGTLRVAAYSSIARSCVIPALAPVYRANTRLVADVAVCELAEITALLHRGSVDFAFSDETTERPDVEHVELGHEELVLVESRRFRMRDDVYLDHDPDDRTTLRFLGRHGDKAAYVRRSFFDDIYGVLDAAVHGFGRAVVPRHLLEGSLSEHLRIVPGSKTRRSPVVLHYFRQPSYTRAHEAVRQALVVGVANALALPPRRRQSTGTRT